MEILLYVALWLLSGFLAAWVFHKNVETEGDLPNGNLLAMMLLGPLWLLPVTFFYTFIYVDKFPPLFKAKEPK